MSTWIEPWRQATMTVSEQAVAYHLGKNMLLMIRSVGGMTMEIRLGDRWTSRGLAYYVTLVDVVEYGLRWGSLVVCLLRLLVLRCEGLTDEPGHLGEFTRARSARKLCYLEC